MAQETQEAQSAAARVHQLDTVQVQRSLLGGSTAQDVQHYAGSRQVITRPRRYVSASDPPIGRPLFQIASAMSERR